MEDREDIRQLVEKYLDNEATLIERARLDSWLEEDEQVNTWLSARIDSTSGIIDYAKASSDKEFLICTENGVCHKLVQDNPDKLFIFNDLSICPDMKKITLESVVASLESLTPEVVIDKELSEKALKPLEKMLELAK